MLSYTLGNGMHIKGRQYQQNTVLLLAGSNKTYVIINMRLGIRFNLYSVK